MKKRIACMCFKVGCYAKREAEKEVKSLLKKHGVKHDKVKLAAKRVAAHGVKLGKEMYNVAMREAKMAMKTVKTAKKKAKKKK